MPMSSPPLPGLTPTVGEKWWRSFTEPRATCGWLWLGWSWLGRGSLAWDRASSSGVLRAAALRRCHMSPSTCQRYEPTGKRWLLLLYSCVGALSPPPMKRETACYVTNKGWVHHSLDQVGSDPKSPGAARAEVA